MAGTIVANTLNTDTVGGVFTTNNAVTGIAKAWVNFTGSTAVINGSFNVSSVTRSSTGVYSISFTTAMPNTNYALVATNASNSTTPTPTGSVFIGTQFQTSSVTTGSVTVVNIYGSSASAFDCNGQCVVFFSS